MVTQPENPQASSDPPASQASFGDVYVARIKHLELIQGVVNRLAGVSLAIKGWCLTLVAAVVGLAAKDAHVRVVVAAFFPAVFFWGLDAYYLRQERLYRKRYDEVRTMPDEDWIPDAFSMITSPEPVPGRTTRKIVVPKYVDGWFAVAVSRTLFAFYVPVIGAILGVTVWTMTQPAEPVPQKPPAAGPQGSTGPSPSAPR